jgi:hypothetical protein
MKGVYEPAMNRKMAAWSKRRSSALLVPGGSQWYAAETANSRIIVPQYTAAAMPCSAPARVAFSISCGLKIAAPRAPAPWLSELAISSLGDWSRHATSDMG